MRKLLLSLCMLFSVALASEVQLKEKLAEAQPGSYLVLEQNKIFTLFHIYDRTEDTVIIEEVSIPAARFARNPMNWKQWFECGAPGHSSWIMSQVNLNSGAFEETFSFTHQGWIDMSESNPFLTTLLNLHFREVPDSHRKKIGMPPSHNKQDRRPLWHPRLTVEGCVIPNTYFSAYVTRWPADGTELSRKIVEIYLPTAQEDAFYPTYFPYWLEVEGKIGSAKVRVIDSGMNAISPKQTLPKRPIQLMGEVQINEEGLSLQIKSPSYYKEFVILAERSDAFFGQTFSLPCQTCHYRGDLIVLKVTKQVLKDLITEGESYRFSISPKENPNIVLETRSTVKTNLL